MLRPFGALVETVVCHAVLREIIGPDPSASVPAADLALSLRGNFRVSLLSLDLVKAGSEYLESPVLILVLTSLILTLHDHSGRYVCYPNSRRGLVDFLTSRSGGSEDVYLNILHIQMKIEFLYLGQYGNSGRRCVNPAARFRYRNSLNTMCARFIFQP